jgi:hypothetical protein
LTQQPAGRSLLEQLWVVKYCCRPDTAAEAAAEVKEAARAD